MAGVKTRSRFKPFTNVITPAVRDIIEDYDDIIGRGEGEVLSDRLRSLSRRSAEVSDDICSLFALFAERASYPPVRDSAVSRILFNLYEKANSERARKAQLVDILVRTVLIGFGAALIVGYFGHSSGLNAFDISNAFAASLQYAFGVAILLLPPTVLVVYLYSDRNWREAFGEGLRIFPFWQYLRVFMFGFAVSVVAQNVWSSYQWVSSYLSKVGTSAETCRTGYFQCYLQQYFGEKMLFAQALYFAPVGAIFAMLILLSRDTVKSSSINSAFVIAAGSVAIAISAIVAHTLYLEHNPPTSAAWDISIFSKTIKVSVYDSVYYQSVSIAAVCVVMLWSYVSGIRRVEARRPLAPAKAGV